jgi:inorganic pyrophosphatase
MTQSLRVYIEIEQYSNQKYEWNSELGKLELDRTLPYPYFYPYSYGFIPQTKSLDGDDIDILVVSSKKISKDCWIKCIIIGALIMEDEKGMDEKLLVVTKEDYEYKNIHNLEDLSPDILDNIKWFFSNYKSKDENRWALVKEFVGRDQAEELMEEAKARHLKLKS